MTQLGVAGPFHLAVPVNDLVSAVAFYEEVLGCTRGRESVDWIDLNFFGHQLVLHKVESVSKHATSSNEVDSELIPVPHFGVVLDAVTFEALADRVEGAKMEFRIAPTTRFAGRVGEQRIFFLQDPCGNCLEFKTFSHPEMLFEKDLSSYE